MLITFHILGSGDRRLVSAKLTILLFENLVSTTAPFSVDFFRLRFLCLHGRSSPICKWMTTLGERNSSAGLHWKENTNRPVILKAKRQRRQESSSNSLVPWSLTICAVGQSPQESAIFPRLRSSMRWAVRFLFLRRIAQHGVERCGFPKESTKKCSSRDRKDMERKRKKLGTESWNRNSSVYSLFLFAFFFVLCRYNIIIRDDS